MCIRDSSYSDDTEDIPEVCYGYSDPNDFLDEDVYNENKSGILYYSDDPYDKLDTYRKVRDHCHLSGRNRGAAHSRCNLNLKLPQNTSYMYIPVFCHNMSGYDSCTLKSQRRSRERSIL